MLHPKNSPNRRTQIPRYLAVQIQIEILVVFRICTKEFEFFDSVDFRGIAFSAESVTLTCVHLTLNPETRAKRHLKMADALADAETQLKETQRAESRIFCGSALLFFVLRTKSTMNTIVKKNPTKEPNVSVRVYHSQSPCVSRKKHDTPAQCVQRVPSDARRTCVAFVQRVHSGARRKEYTEAQVCTKSTQRREFVQGVHRDARLTEGTKRCETHDALGHKCLLFFNYKHVVISIILQ